jgi:hypothetical protein
MSSLSPFEKSKLERLFNMSGGYVLGFSDAEFGVLFGDHNIDIHSTKFQTLGTSKAKKIREFWRLEADQVTGDVMLQMIEHHESFGLNEDEEELSKQCKDICRRLTSAKINLTTLKNTVEQFDLKYINKQIRRIEDSIESDPDLAIGTSKELIESCCKTILDNLNVTYNERKDDLLKLVRLTSDQLGLLPSSVDSEKRGSEVIKKILGNLGMIAQGITEIRNLYGTGHGKSGQASGLETRHARLVATSASALVHFLFETHTEREKTK